MGSIVDKSRKPPPGFYVHIIVDILYTAVNHLARARGSVLAGDRENSAHATCIPTSDFFVYDGWFRLLSRGPRVEHARPNKKSAADAILLRI